MTEKFNYDDIKYLAVALPDTVKALRGAGKFAEELEEIERLTSRGVDPVLGKRLMLEKFIAKHMMKDYGVDRAKMLAMLSEKYDGVDDGVLDEIIKSRHADYILTSDGLRFQNDAYSNVVRIMHKRLTKLRENSGLTSDSGASEPDKLLHENIAEMKKNGRNSYRFVIRESIKPDAEHEISGKLVRAWLPYPCRCAEQSGIELVSSSHNVTLSPDSHPISTAYTEFEYHAGEKFEITVAYTNTAVYHELNPEYAVEGYPAECGEYTLEELPQIVFTPYLRYLASYLAGDEKNPLLVAKRLYDYITENVKYSFLREYRLIDNIPETVALNLYGDCGAQSLLFITLCRIKGIPARWQSGNSVTPGGIGSHDWALFYVVPFGWLYADCSCGGGMYRDGDRIGREWYFGNLDPFRYVGSQKFASQLSPAKDYMRIDPFDNQSGEIEYSDGVLDSDEIDFEKTVVDSKRITE